jgi:hypothetical protein
LRRLSWWLVLGLGGFTWLCGGIPLPLGPRPVAFAAGELDRDGDGLSDSEEAALQTNPDEPDTDGDGLLDGWEIHGVTRDGSHEPLGAYGANPHFPDVFVEIDWMETSDGNASSGALIAYRVAVDIFRIFRASRTGIRVHFDLGARIEELIGPENIEDDGPELQRFRESTDPRKILGYRPAFPRRPRCEEARFGPTSLYSAFRDPRYFRPSRRNLFYYVVIAEREGSEEHRLSGYVDNFADEAARRAGLIRAGVHSAVIYRRHIAPEDAAARRFELTSAVLHELGHAMGLGHGGAASDGGWDNRNNKPNYPSVMNHRYQLAGIDTVDDRRVTDFSYGRFSSIREPELREADGFGPTLPNAHVLAHLGVPHLDDPNAPFNIDFNRNGIVDSESLAIDLDFSATVDGEPSTDHDDWAKFLRDGFGGIGLNAFDGRGRGHDGEGELIRIPGDFDADGWSDLVLFTGNAVAIAYGDESGLGPIRGVYRVTIGGWTLSADDQFLVGRFTTAAADELILHRRDRCALVRLPRNEAVMAWSGSDIEALEPVVVAEEPPAAATVGWSFGKDDELVLLEGRERDLVGVYRAGRGAVFGWRDRRWIVLWEGALDEVLRGQRALSLQAGRRLASGDRSAIFRSPTSAVEVLPVDGVWTARSLDVEGIIPADDDGPGWRIADTDCWFRVDLDGDGTDEIVATSDTGLGVFRELEQGLRLVDLAGEGRAWRIVPGNEVLFGELAPGGGKEILLVQRQGRADLEVIEWVVVGWSSDTERLELVAVQRAAVPDAGERWRPWSLSRSQRVLVGPFLRTELDSVLVQDVDALLVARWHEGGFTQELRLEGRVGPWSLARDDHLEVASTRTRPPRAVVVARNGPILGWFSFDGTQVMSRVQVFDAETLTLSDAPIFRRGDGNADGELDLSDALTLLTFLFQGEGQSLRCADGADTDDSGELDITDVIRLLSYLFLGDATIPSPGPRIPGTDPTFDPLDCVRWTAR